MKATRDQALAAIQGERDYQDKRWNADTTSTAGVHSVTEYLVFMHSYVREAMEIVSRNGEPGASQAALHNVRKIGALAVACMEQNGVALRS